MGKKNPSKTEAVVRRKKRAKLELADSLHPLGVSLKWVCLPFALALCLSTAVVTLDLFLFAYVPFTGCVCMQVRDLCFVSTQGHSPTPRAYFSFPFTALSSVTTSNTNELRDKISAQSEVTDSSSPH